MLNSVLEAFSHIQRESGCETIGAVLDDNKDLLVVLESDVVKGQTYELQQTYSKELMKDAANKEAVTDALINDFKQGYKDALKVIMAAENE